MARPPRRPPPRVLAFALVVVGFVLSTTLIRSGLTAQSLAPVIVTEQAHRHLRTPASGRATASFGRRPWAPTRASCGIRVHGCLIEVTVWLTT